MIHARMGRFPAGTWLLYARPDGLKAAAIVQQSEQRPGEDFQAALVLDGLSDQEVEALIRLLGLAPFPEWLPANPARTRAFFSVDEARAPSCRPVSDEQA
ncbi:hypothetical protein [Thermogemmatispora carboxidivorans]|uniref:hypothetical protein n=1 Tax=Thermogemmatispora carboxidivorans TaxID=1382306 RepID=UPI0012DF35E1|nr:hypothetical protein [Thermogemmatispora carboxidivorans]